MNIRPLALVLWSFAAGCSPAPIPSPEAAPSPAPAIASPAPPKPDTPTISPYVDALYAELAEANSLTLEPRLQQSAERALAANGRAGAVVALDPRDGRVLALYSVPGDRGDPLRVPHQPASTIKSFSAIAALQAGTIQPDTTLSCTGTYAFANLQLTCPGNHGSENVSRALAVSCNVFFYELTAKQGPEPLLSVARAFGFAERTGIELDDQAGELGDGGVDPAQPALALLNAIGHGNTEVSLLGLARAYAAIANGGTLVTLHLTTGRTLAVRRVPYTEATLSLVREALRDGVDNDYGRAHALAIDGYPFAGKTGGVDAPAREGSPGDASIDTWFVAFAPPTEPEVLIAGRVERVPLGAALSAGAGPVVREVLESAAALKGAWRVGQR